MSFLEKIARGEAPTTADLARGSTRLGRLLQREGVPDSPELQRITKLPRRVWETNPSNSELVRLLTKELRTPTGSMELRPHQAVALVELYDGSGLVGGMKVGTGKTLVSFTAPTLVGAHRPVLLVPAKLRPKTLRDFSVLRAHWRGPSSWGVYSDGYRGPGYVIVGYQELGLSQNEKILDDLKPDIIIADEGHYLKNRDAAVTRRVERYFAAHERTRLVIMSGTLLEEREIQDYQHLLRWCLVQGMPLPGPIDEALVWGRAVDRKVPRSAWMSPGALMTLCTEDERASIERGDDEREVVRSAFERRIYETPGIVVTRDVDVAASLQISLIDDVSLPQETSAAIAGAWAGHLPSGTPIEEDDAPRVISQLALGFWYEPDHLPPQEWVEAKRKWMQIVRLVLDRREPGMDSPDQVETAAALGRLGVLPQFERWRAVRDVYQPIIIPRWISYDIIDEIAKRAKQLKECIIWTHYWAPGDALRDRHGFRFFRHEGQDEQGAIEDAHGVIVASVAGCGEGHNLQHRWYQNIVITPPGEPALWEQAICGRTHRSGQEADTVYVHALAHVPTYRATLERLRENATGTSRLAIADWI